MHAVFSPLVSFRNFVQIPQGTYKKWFHGILQLKRRSGDRTWDRSTVVFHPALDIHKTETQSLGTTLIPVNVVRTHFKTMRKVIMKQAI
jgi:hypothetical protein